MLSELEVDTGQEGKAGRCIITVADLCSPLNFAGQVSCRTLQSQVLLQCFSTLGSALLQCSI